MVRKAALGNYSGMPNKRVPPLVIFVIFSQPQGPYLDPRLLIFVQQTSAPVFFFFLSSVYVVILQGE